MKLEVLWNQLVDSGSEHLILKQNDTIEADSLAVGTIEGAAYRLQYQIICDAQWNAQNVRIEELLSRKLVVLRRGTENTWTDGESQPLEALDGCSDIDIMVTPFTNTLPIKRLNLTQGESREITVVYIHMPDLMLSKMGQRYTCLSQDKNGGIYRYESLKGGFTADLKVDTDGLVTDYPGIFKLAWKRKMLESDMPKI